MADSRDSKQMGAALAAIRERLARMRLEGAESMERLAATRQAADVSQAARQSDKPRPEADA